MRVLHVVASSRWTGAAATALQLVEALRARGVDATFAFRSGNNLQARLAGTSWAHAALLKERSPGTARASLTAVRALAAACDLVHAHLPHDHLLARLAGGRPLVRSVHHAGHLRPDPFHRWLFSRTSGVGVSNSAMLPLASRIPALRCVPATVLGPALGPAFTTGSGRAARERLGVPQDTFVAGTVGKLDRSRGQDLLLHALSACPGAWGLIVGAGDFEKGLGRLARRLGVADRVVFAGYVENGLEEAYRAMDVHIFPAAGSDHAHRAIVEAAGCGVPTLAARVPGVEDLVIPGVSGDLFPPEDAAALAVLLRAWSVDEGRRRAAGAHAAARAAERWTPGRLADAALALYAAAEGQPALRR